MPPVRRTATRETRVDASSEKRNKRPPRGQSPAVTSTPAAPALNSLQKITLPARNSVGPGNIPFSREPKARREALAAQLPLQEGRKVAFHPPSGSGTNGPTDESTWILAVVTKCINQDKNRSVFPFPSLSEQFWISGAPQLRGTGCGATGGRPTRSVSTEKGYLQHVDLTRPLGITTQRCDRLYHFQIPTHLLIPHHTKAHILSSPWERQSWRYIQTPAVSIERRF